jgi:succinyl-diaminopimelate desuccinylase
VASPDLTGRTLQLVDVPSESRSEAALVALVRELLPGDALYDDGEVLLYGDPRAPVVLAGHLDTVPAQGNIPGRLADGSVHGLGASDMKAGIAVMIELARAASRRATSSSPARRSRSPKAPSPRSSRAG